MLVFVIVIEKALSTYYDLPQEIVDKVFDLYSTAMWSLIIHSFKNFDNKNFWTKFGIFDKIKSSIQKILIRKIENEILDKIEI